MGSLIDLFGICAGGQLCGFVVFGFLGDWYGRRPMTIACIAGLALSHGLMFVVDSASQVQYNLNLVD